jgi:RND family efflux transporter MFP subunit
MVPAILKYVVTALTASSLALGAAAGEPANLSGMDRGVIVSLSEATITTDLNAPILRVFFKKGETFRKGDVLVEFDCRRYKEELAAAEADARAELSNSRSQTLMESNHAAGRNDVEIAQAKFDKAQATVRALTVRMEQCVIHAPFSGRVKDKLVNDFETPQPNSPLVKIIDDRNLQIVVLLPSKSLSWLKVGSEFEFLVDETGESHAATVAHFGAIVDPVSQTIEVIADFKKNPENVLPGMSGNTIFERPRS